MADEQNIPTGDAGDELDKMLDDALALEPDAFDEFADQELPLDRLLAEEIEKDHIPSGDEGVSPPTFIDEDALLDLELEEALEKDRLSENTTELQDKIEDFVKDLSVYSDDEVLERPVKLGPFSKINSAIEGISPVFLAVAAGVLAVSAAVALFLGITTMVKSNALSRDLASRGTIIRQGTATSNNAGYIYVNTAVKLVDGEVTLTKINLSRVSTVLYFNGYIDMNKYDATLTDDWGRIYNLDRSYYENAEASEETRMWFDPLPQDVGSFTLTIRDLETQISTMTKFTAGQDFKYEYVRYVSESIPVDCDSETASVEVSGAVFSATGSQIRYALKWLDPGEQILLCRPDSDEYLTLTENGRLVSKDTHKFEQYAFEDDNAAIGRVDFMPVQSLDNKVRINFDNMYKKLAVNREVCLADIFYKNASPEMRIDVGPYALVLERGGIQVNQYVIVLHTLDTREEAVSDLSNRVQSFLDVTMVARKPDGTSIRLEPRMIRDAVEGTDIVFDGSEEQEFLLGMPIDQVFFEIENVYVKLPSASVEIDLEPASRKLPMAADNALDAVKLAFERRLGYKSGALGYGELDRFSEGVLQNTLLMRQYEPMAATDVSGGVQVTAWYLDGDRLYSVLQDTWRGMVDGSMRYFHQAHKVVSEYGDRGWIVVDDQLIE